MNAGEAFVYAGPPPWIEVERAFAGLRFATPRMFLVGRSLPGEMRMAIAWLHPSGVWTVEEDRSSTLLGWDPLYVAEPPAYPPWPRPDHPAMEGR